jgi:hypothetical protein
MGNITSGLELINVKAKRRHAGGVHHSTGEPEAYNPKTLAQEVGELLGQALAEYRADFSNKGDQDAYVLTIHGTQLRLVAANFSEDYLRYVQSPTMPGTQRLYVRRSRFYELKDPLDRVEALKVVIGLFRYLMSGSAALEQTRKHAYDLRKYYG